MCDRRLNQESAFAYLDEIKTVFHNVFSQKEINASISYALNDKFKDNIKEKMNYYNSNLNESDNISKLKKGMIEFKDNVLEANEVLMERGEKIQLMVKKADNLVTESINYLGKV